MTHTLSPHARRRYLTEKQAQVRQWMLDILTGYTSADLSDLSPSHCTMLVAVLERLPEEIPTQLVAHLRVALAAG